VLALVRPGRAADDDTDKTETDTETTDGSDDAVTVPFDSAEIRRAA
jgi:hypothetical protein